MSKISYILLADYAKSAGISLEEARELVSKEENKQFFKVANGKEMVSTAIYKKKETPATESKAFEAPATNEEVAENPAPEEAPATNPAPAREEEVKTATPAATTADQEEIERLRKEVAELKEQVKSKDNQIAEYAFRFAELAQQAQLIAGQAQVLQAKEQKLIELPAENNGEKKGFFKRLFGR